MHFEVGVVGVGLARQQRLELAALAFALERLELGEALRLRFRVAFHLAELDQRRGVGKVALDLGERAEAVLQQGALAHQLLRGVGIAPQPRVFRLGVELG